jgi:hypothetical protein
MKLFELLNSKVKYKVDTEASDAYEETATIGGRKIIFSTAPGWVEDSTDKSWEVAFMTRDPSGKKEFTTKKTGEGGELKVFSFVLDALKRFVYGYDPKAFHFSADDSEPTRVRLYKAFANRFKDDDYTMEVKKIHGHTYWCYTNKWNKS